MLGYTKKFMNISSQGPRDSVYHTGYTKGISSQGIQHYSQSIWILEGGRRRQHTWRADGAGRREEGGGRRERKEEEEGRHTWSLESVWRLLAAGGWSVYVWARWLERARPLVAPGHGAVVDSRPFGWVKAAH
jgi:hypothetical protein